MKKRRIAVMAMISLSVLSLSSCIMKNTDLTINKDLSYTFTDSDWEKVQSEMTAFENAIKNNGNAYDVVGSWNKLNRDAYAIATYRQVEYINYCMGDENAFEKYSHYQELLNEILQFEESMYQPIYDSEYKSQFFSGYTEEEIEDLLDSALPDEFYDIDSENEELLASYREDEKNGDYSKVSETYLALVKNYEKQAALAGYDDFMSYSYKENYSRDYKPEEVEESYNGYVKDYIVPLMESLCEKEAALLDSASSEDKKTYSAFTSSSFENYRSIFDEYAEFIGDDFLTNYNHLWSEGYLKKGVSGTQNVDGAFTAYLYISTLDEPIMYFGSDYQDILTLVHEFGHYNAMSVKGAGNFSYDLAESQSQGDEALFTTWLTKNNKFSDTVTDLIYYGKILETCQTIVLSSVVNEFEYEVYHKTDLSASDFDSLWIKAFDVFGGYDSVMETLNDISSIFYGESAGSGTKVEYWKRVVLDNPCYYISYAMSNIPVMQIFAKSENSISEGKQVYKLLYNYSEEYNGTDFDEILTSAGLYTPFDENAYKTLYKLAGEEE